MLYSWPNTSFQRTVRQEREGKTPMAYCGICGRHHDPATPCAVANRPAGGKSSGSTEEGRKLAKRVDWILAIAAVLALAVIFYLASR
jgi:hypothetical protein